MRQPPSHPKQRSVFVLGMHRSGTSVLSESLRILGAKTGTRMLPPGWDNPKGFGEDEDVLEFNRRLLKTLGAEEDHGLAPWGAFDPQAEAVSAFPAALQELLTDKFNDATFWSLKDPRITLLLPLWKDVVARMGADLKCVISLRNPLSCARSLAKRNGFPIRTGLLHWLIHHYALARHLGETPYCLVSYEKMLSAPRQELLRLAQFLDIDLTDKQKEVDEFVSSFLEKSLDHNTATIQDLEHSAPDIPQLSDIYKMLIDLDAVPQGSRQALKAIEQLLTNLPLAEQCALGLFPREFAQLKRTFPVRSKLYVDAGHGFVEEDTCVLDTTSTATSFSFDLQALNGLKAVRFDPCESCCVLKLHAVRVTFFNGDTKTVYPSSSNACRVMDDLYFFDTEDPNIFFGFNRIVRAITFEMEFKAIGDYAHSLLFPPLQEAHIEQTQTLDEKLQRLEEAGRENDALTATLNAARDDLNAASDQTALAEARGKALQAENDDLHHKLKNSAEDMLRMQAQFEELSQRIADQQTDSERENAELEALQTTLTQLTIERDKLADQVAELETTKTSLLEDMEQTAKKLELEAERNSTVESSLAELKASHSELLKAHQQSMHETDVQMQRAQTLEFRLQGMLNSLTWRSSRVVLGRLKKFPRTLSLLTKLTRFLTKQGVEHDVGKSNAPCEKQGDACGLQKEPTLLRGASRTSKTFVISSHDASRTGAPLIILNIAQRLVRDKGINCLFLLLKGGPLLEDFRALGPVCVVEEWQQHPANVGVPLKDLVGCMLMGHNPVFGILNSAESHPLYSGLKQAGVPFIGLVHEFADPYPQHTFQLLANLAEEIIFPSQIVYDAAVAKLGRNPGNISIRPQGLFDASFPQGDRETARAAILKKLALEDDTFLVLGCGYVDLRKGCDIFVQAARRLKKDRPDAKIMFVWLGSMDTGVNMHGADFIYWLNKDLQTSDSEEYVRFVGAYKDVAPWFHAADCMFMSSRQDPFPCVVLEAMAARLPVICFENATGSVDAVGTDAGFMVPHLDVNAACEKIAYLHDNPEKSRTMGEAARQKVLKAYDYGLYVDELCEKIAHHAPHALGNLGKAPSLAECKNIYVPCADWGLSGVNSALENIGAELCKLGWNFQILFTSPEKDVLRSANGHMPQRVKYGFLNAPARAPQKEKWQRLIDFYEAHAPCILFTGYDYLHNAIAPALTNDVGVVLWNQSDDMEYYEQVHRLGRYANKMVCVSNVIANEIKKMNPALSDLLTVIPNGAIRKCDLATDKKSPGKKIKIIYAGRLVQYQKRVRDFVKLVEELDKASVGYEFSIVGEDHDGSGKYLKAELARHIDRGIVKMPGRLCHEDVLKAYEKSDIFILISDFEGMPLSLTEAMGKGCVPVVSNIRSGIAEVITQENGVIVPGWNYTDWAAAIKRLSDDRQTLARMSAAARTTVAERFTVDQLALAFDETFSTILDSILNQNYQRPATLKWRSSTGDVLPPQQY